MIEALDRRMRSPLMPKGVEHSEQQRIATLQTLYAITSDAERR